ncbi:MAG: hypothetical protein Fur0041_09840 [Bacteroidia bacterium]
MNIEKALVNDNFRLLFANKSKEKIGTLKNVKRPGFGGIGLYRIK